MSSEPVTPGDRTPSGPNPSGPNPSGGVVLARTPLDAFHRERGGTMVPFAGYEMPVQYQSIVAEHRACRDRAAMFDVSHMGRLRFDGEGSEDLLDRVLTRKIAGMPVGAVRYAMVCNAEGGILDDVLVSHLQTPSGQRYHLMVVNASNRSTIFNWIADRIDDFPTVTMTDRTDLTAMIAVQGPRAIESCRKLFTYDPSRLKYYQARVTDQFNKPAIVSRTGYTGEDGFELICRAEDAERVWENIRLAGREAGFEPAGLGARDTLRMEAAMPLYGHEIDLQTDPISAGLRFGCTMKDRDFIGRDAIARVIDAGPQRVRIGLLIDGKRPARQGCQVLSTSGDSVGVVTSGGPSPTLGRPIAMASVDAVRAAETGFIVDIRGKQVSAEATEMPFYRRRR